MQEQWDKYIDNIARILATKESYQILLGEQANEVIDKFGSFALKDLAEAIKDRHGIQTSHKTLYNYAWVMRKTKEYHLPDDISFRVRQMIAGSADPKHWVEEIDKGMSSAEVAHALRPTEDNNIVCPYCKKEFDAKKT